MDSEEIRTELAHRISADAAHFSGRLPRSYAIAWRGYLAGLLEWGLISVSDYEALTKLVPPVEDDPAAAILRGRD